MSVALFIGLVVALCLFAPDIGTRAVRFLAWLFWIGVFLALCWVNGHGLVHELLWRASWSASYIS